LNTSVAIGLFGFSSLANHRYGVFIVGLMAKGALPISVVVLVVYHIIAEENIIHMRSTVWHLLRLSDIVAH